MLCRRLWLPFKPLLEENKELVRQSSRQAIEVPLPPEAGIQAQMNNHNPGVPPQREAEQWKANAGEEKQDANILLLPKSS